jgi:GNAT superfamily N-acetyltransferase
MMSELTFRPVTAERWPDLERLFSESAGEELGNPSRCWCMEWRLANHQEWLDGAGERNRAGMEAHVAAGHVPGLIAYIEEHPLAWISVSPRPDLIGMRQAGEFRRFEDPKVWSIICFYVPETLRGRGLMVALLEAAVSYAAQNGARLVEGYPFVKNMAGDGAGGTVEAFEKAGFKRYREIRPGQYTMRYHLES